MIFDHFQNVVAYAVDLYIRFSFEASYVLELMGTHFPRLSLLLFCLEMYIDQLVDLLRMIASSCRLLDSHFDHCAVGAVSRGCLIIAPLVLCSFTVTCSFILACL